MGYLLKLAEKIRIPERQSFPFSMVDIKSSPDKSANKTEVRSTPAAISETSSVVNPIWNNPYPQGSAEARQETLLQVMIAVTKRSFDNIAMIWPRGFVSTQEIFGAESEAERVQRLVMNGKATLKDYRTAVEAWETIVKNEIDRTGLEKN